MLPGVGGEVGLLGGEEELVPLAPLQAKRASRQISSRKTSQNRLLCGPDSALPRAKIMPKQGKARASIHPAALRGSAICAEPPAVVMVSCVLSGPPPACRVGGEKEHELLAGRRAQEKAKLWPAAPPLGSKLRVKVVFWPPVTVACAGLADNGQLASLREGLPAR